MAQGFSREDESDQNGKEEKNEKEIRSIFFEAAFDPKSIDCLR